MPEEDNVNKKNKKIEWDKLSKIISGILVVGTIITLIIIATQKKISLFYPILISLGILAISVFIWFSNSILKWSKNISNLKESKPAGKKDVRDILNEEVKNMMNHLKKEQGIISKRTENINKNRICIYKVNLLYPHNGNKQVYIVINASDTSIEPMILLPHTKILERYINRMALNPEEEPDVVERKTQADDFGRPIEITKEIKHKKSENNKKEKEDLI